jgi:rhodanese-related sulfurtransferase
LPRIPAKAKPKRLFYIGFQPQSAAPARHCNRPGLTDTHQQETKMRIKHLIGGMALACLATMAQAVEETPNAIPGGSMVDAAKAKALFDKGAVFVDARVSAEYAEKHIKGAINVVYKEVHKKVSTLDPKDEFDLGKLPADKAKPMVFYCNGSPCWRGYKGADAAIKAGYKNVNWFRDGLPAWEAKSFPTE